MPKYKLTDGTAVLRLDDSSIIGGPGAPGYDEYLTWLAQGNAPEPADVVIPNAVSPRQIRQALTAAGLRAQVESAVSVSSQDMKDWWEFATVFERQHPMIVGMAQQLGIGASAVDALFIAASSI